MHGPFGCARRARGKANQRHIIAPHRGRREPHRFRQGRTVKFGVVVGRAIKADHGFQEPRVFGANHQIIHQPRVAQRQRHLGLVDNLAQFPRPQHRHGVHHNSARLGGRQPARHHRRIVGRPDQHAISGLYAVVFNQSMRDAVRPIGKFLIGPPPPIADQGHIVTKATINHPVGQFGRGIDPVGIGIIIQQVIGLLIGGGQAVAAECVGMARWSQHHTPPGITAVASISTKARSSTKATTCTKAIAG